ERDFHRGCEPAQAPAVVFAVQKRRLGQIHLPGNLLHPVFVRQPGEKADGRRIAAERFVGERIDLVNGKAHELFGIMPRSWRAPIRFFACIGTLNPPLSPPRRGTDRTRTNACSPLRRGRGWVGSWRLFGMREKVRRSSASWPPW